MKIIFLALAIYAHTFVALGASTETSSRNRYGGLKDFVENKCFENSHSKNAFSNLEQAAGKYAECTRRTLPKKPPHPVEQYDEFCRYFDESGYYTCIQNVADNMVPCLDKTEIFFPHMILNAYNTTLNNFCGTNGLVTTEYFFKALENNKECLQEAVSEILQRQSCFEHLTIYKNIMENNVVDLNQHDYCIDMESFVNCATGVIQQKCDEDLYLIISSISDLFLNVCEK